MFPVTFKLPFTSNSAPCPAVPIPTPSVDSKVIFSQEPPPIFKWSLVVS